MNSEENQDTSYEKNPFWWFNINELRYETRHPPPPMEESWGISNPQLWYIAQDTLCVKSRLQTLEIRLQELTY